jgi:hypothetical protein
LTARMSLAVMDSTKSGLLKTADSVYGKFMYIGANSTISFAAVINKVGTIYGAAGGGSYDSAEVTASGVTSPVFNCAMKDKVIHGTLKAGAAAITVAAEGLYYTVVDLNTGEFIIAPVKPEIVGDVPYFSWSKPNTFLLPTAMSKDGATFQVTGVNIASAEGYLYRLNDGYAFYEGPNFATHSFLAQIDYGTAWAAGVNSVSMYYNQNLANVTTGVFTVELDYVASTDTWTEKKTKTGNILVDYTNVAVGLEGNAYVYAPQDTGAFAGNGSDGYQVEKPTTIAGSTYTWKWTNVPLFNTREFIFLQAATWGAGLQIDASNPTVTGTAITNGDIVDATKAPFSEQYHNFRVVNGIDLKSGTGNTFDLTLVQDAAANTTTVNIDRH